MHTAEQTVTFEVNIHVYSRMAEVCGHENTFWDGILRLEIPADKVWPNGPLEPVPDKTSLHEAIFRALNMVTDDDARRLEDLGYELPSLSVGDCITYTVKGRKARPTYEVLPMGFRLLT